MPRLNSPCRRMAPAQEEGAGGAGSARRRVKEHGHAGAVSEPGSKVVAKAPSEATTASTPMEQGAYIQGFMLEPATRIERATCGLRNRCSTN